MLLIVMITASVIGIPVSQELSEHLLDVIQGFLLGLGGLLLSFQPSKEVIITVYQPYVPTLYLFVSS